MKTISILGAFLLLVLTASMSNAQECKDGKCFLRKAAEALVPDPVHSVQVVSVADASAIVTQSVSVPNPERKVINSLRYSKSVMTVKYRVAKLFRCRR